MNNIKNKIKSLTDDKEPDYILFFSASTLIIISIIFSYSLSIYTVVYHEYIQFHFFLRQFLTGVFAIFVMWTLSQVKPEKLINNLGWLLFGTFLFLIIIMQFLPSSLVTETGGAKRWIKLPGFSLSPVEFFKIGFIYFLANSFHRRLTGITKLPFKEEVKLILPYGIAFGFVAVIIAVLQKDLGQVVLLGTTLFIMLMFANRSWKVFASLIGIAIAGLAALILFFPHRIARIKSWWSMVQDGVLSIFPDFIAVSLRVKEFPEPYQVGHSLNAINNGGLFGTGLGEGALKLGFLSEVHTDFVLAGITEEIGFAGLLFILLIFLFIIIRIFRTSRRVQDTRFHLFSLGVGLMVTIAFLINSYGISGLIPIKGIAVPFLSYGGSSILATSFAMGMVLSISRNIDHDTKKRDIMENTKTVVITGGGTGGHLSVARSFIEELYKKNYRVIFIGSTKGQDRLWFENEPKLYKAFFLDTKGVVSQNLLGKIGSLFMIIKGVLKSISILRKYKVSKVISVGGFSAASASFASIVTRTPFYIHEQNSVMGKLNSITSKFAKEVFSSYLESSKIKDYPINQELFKHQRVRKEIKTIIFLGGSQGAKAINDFALESAPFLKEKNINIIHQAGKNDYERVKKEYKKLNIQADVFDFTTDILIKMDSADFAVSRAGASTLWELTALGIPTLFIPFPYAAANHQYHNAKYLLEKKLCFLQTQDKLSQEDIKKIFTADIEQISMGLTKTIKKDAIKSILEIIE